MKFLLVFLVCVSLSAASQTAALDLSQPLPDTRPVGIGITTPPKTDISIKRKKWSMDGNKILTGGLLFFSGAAKGFNESLQFHYKGFADIFPEANVQWFYPPYSASNKYKDGDPAKGPKFLMSTSLLVMFTDQYHLNNFIQRAAMTAALVIKIGEGKKPFKHYVLDAIYYTACYQAGFHSIFAPIKARNN